MNIAIQSLIGINDCTLLIYSNCNKMYRLSLVNNAGKVYSCDTEFYTLESAKSMGVCIIERFAVNHDETDFLSS